MKTPLAWMLGIAAIAVALRVNAGDAPAPDPRIENLQRRLNRLEEVVGEFQDATLEGDEFTFTQDIVVRELLVAAKNSKASIRATVIDDVPALGFTDAHGRVRATIGVLEDAAIIGLADRNGRPRAALAIGPDGLGVFQTMDSAGRIIARVGLPTTQPGVGSAPSDPKAVQLLQAVEAAERVRLEAEAKYVSAREKGEATTSVKALADAARRARAAETEAGIRYDTYATIGAR